MTFVNRQHVEDTGRANVHVVEDKYGTRARQLNTFWVYVDPDDHGYTKHALGDGFWESWVTLWMDRNVAPGARALDIGANHGYYSFFLASKGCHVTAAEPQPRLVDLLVKSDAVNETGIDILPSAISDKSGEKIEMMVPVHHGMNATISNQHSYAPDGQETVLVDTTTLDNLGRVYGWFDFIKVDAEGAEDLIWAGSKEYRKQYPNTLWLMEWRWDRYTDPAAFAAEIFREHDVSHVTFDGTEERIHMSAVLATKQHEDWMLVLRKK